MRVIASRRFACCFLLIFPRLASTGFSKVRCTKPVCLKEQRPVRREGAPKTWAYGCNATTTLGVVHSCCLDKEICMRTCGMLWSRCDDVFEKCVFKTCGQDSSCLATAERAEQLIMGGDSHTTVCKTFRDAQQELCDCVPFKDAREGANARLTSFYAAYSPERLDDQGSIKGAEDVWKKWQGREPELFFELTRKYGDALEVRQRSDEEIANLQAEEDYARRKEDDELARRRAEEEEARLRAEMEMARRQAEQEEMAKQQQEDEHRRYLEDMRTEVAMLREAKAAAIAQEDFLQAKELNARITELTRVREELNARREL